MSEKVTRGNHKVGIHIAELANPRSLIALPRRGVHVGEMQDAKSGALQVVHRGRLRAHGKHATFNERAPRESAAGNQTKSDADGARRVRHERLVLNSKGDRGSRSRRTTVR